MSDLLRSLGTLERGCLLVIEWPDEADIFSLDDQLNDLRRHLAHQIGHDQFAVLGVVGSASVVLHGPEGMREVIERLSAEQLAQLAGGGYRACLPDGA